MQAQPKRQEEAHGERDAEHVVDTGPDEVAPDGGEDGAREVQRRDDVEQVRAHEHDVGRFDRHGRAGGERDADRRRGERRRVVDAVPDLTFVKSNVLSVTKN